MKFKKAKKRIRREFGGKSKRRPSKKVLVFRRDAGRCFYCTAVLDIEDMTLEHIKAKSHGGKDFFSNLRCACRTCNMAVGNLPRDTKMKLRGKMLRGQVPEWARASAA